MALVLDAHAKVNLSLLVCGRRADGYHEVDTILHEISLHDTLIAERHPSVRRDISLLLASETSTGLPVLADADNLVARAARLFQNVVPSTDGVRFCLTKRIPAGGGLGGGSADAAAALRLMNALYDHPLDATSVHELAARLGADVPFFLRGGSQRGVGIGTELTPLPDSRPLHFVLLLPRVGTSTIDIYKNHVVDRLTTSEPATNVRGRPRPTHQEAAMASGFPNDLEPTALRLHPALRRIRDAVVEAGFTGLRMSGSGSTFFLAMQDESERDEVCQRLRPLAGEFSLLRCATRLGGARRPQPAEFPSVD